MRMVIACHWSSFSVPPPPRLVGPALVEVELALAALVELADPVVAAELAADALAAFVVLAALVVAAPPPAALVAADVDEDVDAVDFVATGAVVAVAVAPPQAASAAAIAEAETPSAAARRIKSRRVNCPLVRPVTNERASSAWRLPCPCFDIP
ncbi:MAG TPA: hypothetical protein VFU78_12275 [Thermomicrobiales bacterium]|nr:hypothetical protein [Thermomicrobiales bacterium]